MHPIKHISIKSKNIIIIICRSYIEKYFAVSFEQFCTSLGVAHILSLLPIANCS